jgi:hypothetical protein
MNLPSFFAELKRRNVYKVAIAYGVVAWLLMQIASQIFPFFEIPNWAVRLVVLLLIIGFPVAVILAWAFELTPEGIKRAEDVDLNKSVTRKTGRKLDFFYHRCPAARHCDPRFPTSSSQCFVGSFFSSGEKHRGSPIREPERRKSERLLRRRYSG